MHVEEIVGAIIDSRWVLTDRKHIDASMAKGLDVQLIGRSRARWLSLARPSSNWIRLANAPTLFVLDQGIRYSTMNLRRNRH